MLKAGKPLLDKEMPETVDRKTKYQNVWNALDDAPAGSWIPVPCPDGETLLRLQMAAGSRRKNGPCETRKAGLILYIRKRKP